MKQQHIPLSIGYQLPDRYSFVEVAATYRDAIAEVYFPWLGIPDGRGLSMHRAGDQSLMEVELRELGEMGIRMNVLFNANCYGASAVSVSLEHSVTEILRRLRGEFDLKVVTTASFFIARLCKRHFPEIEVRASVNMGIGTPCATGYISEYFDSFYAKRELNRDFAALRVLKKAAGKPMWLLANSGCLRDCPAHTFHDNLVAHEAEMNPRETAWAFTGLCWEYYAKPENRRKIIENSTWLKPEEIDGYADVADGIKLATRTNPKFGTVIKAYAERRFEGDMLSLCEPDFSALFHGNSSTQNTRGAPCLK